MFIPFAFQVTALLSAGARLMVCLRSSVGRPCRLAVTRNSLGINIVKASQYICKWYVLTVLLDFFGNLLHDANPALPGAYFMLTKVAVRRAP